MGIINLKITVGAVNYTNYLHVTAAKVSSPTVINWEDWLPVPFTNNNFVIPNLDDALYYITYYDAPTYGALGQQKMQLTVDALTAEFTDEKVFYTCGGNGTYDPVDGADSITDPYLIGKTVTGIFKEAFRFLKVGFEYSFDPVIGKIQKLDAIGFNSPEVISVDIKYRAPATGTSTTTTGGGGLYNGTLTVTDPTYTLLAADRNKLVRCAGATSKQAITLTTLASINIDDGFYFDNSVGGSAVQVKIFTQGGDRISYNGFGLADNTFAEFWVSKGEHLLIKKFNDTVYEVRSDYKGVDVGARIASGLISQAGHHAEDGSKDDGDEYGRVWWYINHLLPNTHFVVDANVANTNYIPDPARAAQFVIHPALKIFRWPNSQGLSEKGLTNFNTYGIDTANRPYDYPMGFQAEMEVPHDHWMFTTPQGNNTPPYICMLHSYNGNADSYSIYSDNSKLPSVGKTGKGGGTQGRVNNFGVIYARKI